MAHSIIDLETFEFTPDGEEIILELRGRPPLLSALLLRAIGLETTTALIVTRRTVQFQWVGLRGEGKRVYPLNQIRSISTGVAKPVWALPIALLFGIVGLVVHPLFLIGSVAFVGLFVMSRRLTVAFSTEEWGGVYGVAFVPRMSNGRVIEADELRKMLDPISRDVLTAPRSIGPETALQWASRRTVELHALSAHPERTTAKALSIPIAVLSNQSDDTTRKPNALASPARDAADAKRATQPMTEARQLSTEDIFGLSTEPDEEDTVRVEALPTIDDLRQWFRAECYDDVVAGATRLLDHDPRHIQALQARYSAYLKLGKNPQALQDKIYLDRLQTARA